MTIALVVLVLALVLVLVKDRDVLFSPAAEDAEAEPAATAPNTAQIPEDKPVAPALPESSSHERQKVRARRPALAATAVPSSASTDPPPIVVTDRAVLPPLEVEVVAGNQRHDLDASGNSVNIRMQDGIAPISASGEAPPVATEPEHTEQRVQLSPGTAQLVDNSVQPTYPLLAKQMKVQGAVILEALINKAGTIENIQVLSGPAILSAAAREAVRQWRFKPYFKAGRPVDSQARVTVNFTISTE